MNKLDTVRVNGVDYEIGGTVTIDQSYNASSTNAQSGTAVASAINGKVDKTTTVNGHALSGNVTVTKSDVGLGNVTNDAQVKRSEMGTASGVATLDSAGKVPSSQLPSYVDDVLEYDTKSAFPATGEGGKIYVDKSNNTSWRWSGTAYVQIKGDLAIGTTTGTAADGGSASSHYANTSNPHSVTKTQVGLGSVVNTGDSATPVSGGTTKFTTGGAYTELAKKVDKVSGKGLSTNDYTTDEKNKLSGIASGAQANVIETVKVNGTALTPSSKAVDVTVPTKTSELTNNSNFVSDASYVHTDNNYTATEKSKLSGIASGAEVNQNAFSNIGVKVGNTTTTVAADAKTDTVTLIQGSNVTLTADTTNDTVTIAAKDTTYSAATTTAAGLMSADDKTKLNGIAAGAEVNVNADWNATSGDAQILNKPTIPAAAANGTYTIKTLIGSTTTNVSDFTANQSSADDFTIVLGANVTITPDATNRKITIAATDTNTWRPVSDSVSSTSSSDAASSKAVKTAYDLAASKTANTGTVTKVTAGTGLTGGDITTTGTIALATSGVTAGTYKRVTVDAYGRVTAGDNTDANDNTARLQVSDTTNKRINTKESTGNYIQFTAGTNKFTVGDGTNSFDVAVTPSVTFPVSSVAGNTGAVTTAQIATALTSAGYKLTDNNTTYNFSGTAFTSNNSTGVSANDVTYNAHTYYTSNGPAQSLGASTNDGALYSQAYSTSWVGQIAQDYRNGGLYVRGKNNGTWQSWNKVWDSRNLTKLSQLTNDSGFTSNAGTITGITMNGASKGTSGVVNLGTVLTSHQDISGKVDKTTTVNGHALSGNVSVTKSDVGLGNVGNFKAVSTAASQGLTDTEKSNARANIGAGTSSFSGSYNDLSNKPTIPAAAANGTYTIKTLVESTETNVSDFTANQSSADDLIIVQGENVTITPDPENRKITIAAKDTTYPCLSPVNGGGAYSLVTRAEKYTWGTLYDCGRHANNASFDSVPNNRPGVMMTTSSDFPYSGTQWFWIYKSYSGIYGICKLIYLGDGSVGYKNGETWIRTLYNGTWQSWKKVFAG